VLRADKVAVLEGGRIVEEGRPSDLLHRNSTFARLFGVEPAIDEAGAAAG
jgi:ABC-type multidrug transport system fused ATPase/permease subunit